VSGQWSPAVMLQQRSKASPRFYVFRLPGNSFARWGSILAAAMTQVTAMSFDLGQGRPGRVLSVPGFQPFLLFALLLRETRRVECPLYKASETENG